MRLFCVCAVALLLAACQSADHVAANGISHVIDLGSNIRFDTNGYYGHRSGPAQKICEVRVSRNVTKWVPCK